MAESVTTSTVSPLDYFTGDIQKSRLGFRYRLALAVVCAGMVLLPLLYLALVVAVAAGAVWYAVAGFALLATPTMALVKLALYSGPLLGGVVVVVFLLKPIFARSASRTHSLSLSHEDQPELFQFLGRLCQLVNAPPPSRVDVNCAVNASASFRGGFDSLWGNDLVLTIGLPLAAGITARQFAGVIAHELGHFAQDGAMRSGYLIEAVNRWFYRVVYERDEWDVWLSEASGSGTGFLMIVALFARLGVWLSRKVLFVLMFAGVALSRYLRRQMEFDADSYTAKVAGSAAVGEMLHQLSLLGVANQAAYENLGQLWRQRKLVDDFSALVLSERGRISGEFEAQARQWSLKMETVWYSTHPSYAERIAAAERLAEPGVFVLDEPARCLFRDFSSLSKEATRHHYEQEHGLQLRDNNYKPVEEAVAERAEVVANRDVLVSFAPGAGSIWWPVTIDARYLGAPADAAEIRAALESVVQQIGESKAVVTESVKALIDAENRTIHLLSAKCLTEAGIEFESADFGLPDPRLPAIERVLAAKKAEIEALESELVRYSERYGTRFMAAAQLLYDSGLEGKIPNVVAKREEALRLVTVLAKLQRVAGSLRDVGRRVVQLQAVFRRVNDSVDGARVDRATRPVFRDLGRRTSAIRTELLGVIYPFEHAVGKITLIDFCRPEEMGGSEDHQNYLAALAWLQRLPSVYSQGLSRLAGILAEVERAAGIENEIATDSPVTEG